MATSTVLAQLDLTETYTAEDKSFEFMYPSDWTVDDSGFADDKPVLLTGSIDTTMIVMGFMGPTVVDTWTGGATDLNKVVDILGTVLKFDNNTDIKIDGRAAVMTTFDLSGSTGFAITTEMDDGGFGVVLIITSPEDAMQDVGDDITQIVATFNSPKHGFSDILSGNKDTESSSSTPDKLSDYNSDDWRDAVAELEDKGLIGSGGTLIFNEPRAFFDGIGSWFTPLSRRTSRRDVVVAAELEFNSDSKDLETCSLLARIVSKPGSNTVDTYLEVGFDNDGNVYWVDSAGDNFDSDVKPVHLAPDEPHHLLFLALDKSLTVYVDGKLIFDNAQIEARSGSFGIALLGKGADSRCAGTNIWAYDAPIFIPGLCEVAAAGTVNKRSGPGTNFDRAGTLAGGDRVQVKSQAEDDSGFVWYELEDGSWVREDVISLMGDCANIPEN